MKQMKLLFPDDDVVALAELWENEAPRTSAAIWEALPLDGRLHHAIWSGPETYLPIDASIHPPPENQATLTQVGDIGYYAIEGGRIVDWPDDFAEIAFFYGRGARPSMPTGPVSMNLFAGIVDNLKGFAEICDRIRFDGVKRLRVVRAD